VSSLYSIQQSPVADSKGNVTREPDNTLDSVARAGVRQKLPYGGEVVAQVINSLVRDVSNHITDGETGQALITADLPLLRGAGRSAFETRYQAERNLIYALRTFEGFRRNLVVIIAADYFNLQNLRQQIDNTDQSMQSFSFIAQQTQALMGGGRRSILDVQRAEQEKLVAANDRVDAIATYETALDTFKLRIGMPVETPIDVPLPSEPGVSSPAAAGSEAVALHLPAVNADEAIAAALKYRLDLLNDLDRIGDAERGVNIAENNLLPDLRATSSVAFNTRTEQMGVGHYDDEYGVYRAGLTLELPLDRTSERNALRRSQVTKNEAQRTYEQSRHTVILQVRNAMRRIEQQQLSLQIQIKNRDLALQRREAAKDQLDRGLVGNRDLVEAENALLAARNRLAAAQAGLSLAVLQFRRDTGTLRVGDDGKWTESPMAGS
jgi:outer membrane protein TolC